jgi:hypothetical protein
MIPASFEWHKLYNCGELTMSHLASRAYVTEEAESRIYRGVDASE